MKSNEKINRLLKIIKKKSKHLISKLFRYDILTETCNKTQHKFK